MNDNMITGTFRSRLNQLPFDLKCKLGEIPLQIGMHPPAKKELIRKYLNESGIDWLQIGDGTNRVCIKYDGYVIKIALDKEGIADNKQEFAICEQLAPDVSFTHEISKGGHLVVATYCPAFSSYTEMQMHAQTIKSILERWSRQYLLGDVGVVMKNYANWGLSPNGKPVCIDYAYIFPASFNLFACDCGSLDVALTDATYSEYKCLKCGTRYPDTELRMHISQEQRLRMFENAEGLEVKQSIESHLVPRQETHEHINPDMPSINELDVPGFGFNGFF